MTTKKAPGQTIAAKPNEPADFQTRKAFCLWYVAAKSNLDAIANQAESIAAKLRSDSDDFINVDYLDTFAGVVREATCKLNDIAPPVIPLGDLAAELEALTVGTSEG